MLPVLDNYLTVYFWKSFPKWESWTELIGYV